MVKLSGHALPIHRDLPILAQRTCQRQHAERHTDGLRGLTDLPRRVRSGTIQSLRWLMSMKSNNVSMRQEESERGPPKKLLEPGIPDKRHRILQNGGSKLGECAAGSCCCISDEKTLSRWWGFSDRMTGIKTNTSPPGFYGRRRYFFTYEVRHMKGVLGTIFATDLSVMASKRLWLVGAIFVVVTLFLIEALPIWLVRNIQTTQDVNRYEQV